MKVNNNEIIELLNQDLGRLEKNLISDFESPKFPPIFIVGIQRSGSTFLNQLLINNFNLYYPNNIIARFWKAPTVGVAFSESLPEQNNEKISFQSEFGNTSELLGPHEFGFFWSRYFPTGQVINTKKTSLKKYQNLKRTLAAMEYYGGLPLIFKNLTHVSQNIQFLKKLFPNAIFIYIKRKPFYIVQSTYLTRLKKHEDENQWFGVIPKEHEYIENEEPISQITKQVYYVKNRIENQLKDVKGSNKIIVDYESVVNKPHSIVNVVNKTLKKYGIKKKNTDNDFNSIANNNEIKTNEKIRKKIEENIRVTFKYERTKDIF